jgi:pSer/pThr/pTyr-binding forkhead associated (FHA) protein
VFNITVVLSGTRVRTKGALANREIFVGRSKKCHLVLQDETVSGVHCRLIAIEGGVIVLDEGSTNGTWLNGEPVLQPALVTVDDELRVGPFRLVVQSLVGGRSPAMPRPRLEPRGKPERLMPSAKAEPSEARPLSNEPPTDVQLSQAKVFWKLLGFHEPATLAEARAAYLRLKTQYRPETLARLTPELREQGEQKVREIEFAWTYIQRLLRHTPELPWETDSAGA